MTSDDELTAEQVEELRALLLQGKEEIERSLASSSENAKPVDLGLSIGRLSRVDALQQQQMAVARRQRLEQRLQQIRGALSRAEAGTYGACITCGEAIGFARLRARPEALSCRECHAEEPRR